METDFLEAYNIKHNRQQESLRELIHYTNICPEPTLCLATWGDEDIWVTNYFHIRRLISIISSEESRKEENIYSFETYLQGKCNRNIGQEAGRPGFQA